jgi:acyl dehydratase
VAGEASDAWKRAWAPVVARVGQQPAGGEIRWGVDLVERGAIRRFLEPLEFDCPLHYDLEVARSHGYPDVVAPYTSAVTFAMGPLWSPGAPAFPSAERNTQPVTLPIDPTEYPPEATGLFATDFEVEFRRPPVVGDRLGGTGRKIVDAALKVTRVGRGAFLKFQSELVDADELPILTLRTGLFVYEPIDPVGKGEGTVPGMPDRPAPSEWSEGPEGIRLDRQRVAGDVRPGELLTPVAFPLPVFRLVMEAGANRDFNLIHHNTEFARSSGAPEMYANTLFLQSMWEVLVRNYIGCAGTIKKIAGFRMGAFNCAGDTVTVKGRVEKITPGEGETVLELFVWSENAHGISVGPGTVTVGVPNEMESA